MKSAILVFGSLLVLAMAHVASAAPALPATPPAGIEWHRAVVMGKGGDKPLHAEVMLPSPRPGKPTPAIILVHGGGWRGGNNLGKWVFTGFQLAKRGYCAASIEYRLSDEAPWPAQIQDCKLAVRWLRANAATYNVDPDRIGCWGSSAGGHLVACMGTMDDPALEGDGGYASVSSKVQAVADLSGPTDFRTGNFVGKDDAAEIDADHQAKDLQISEYLFGGPFAKNPAAWKQGSPLLWVKPGDPPFFLLYGDKDSIVPLSQGTSFAAALKSAGVPVIMDIDKGAGHCGGPVKGQPAPAQSLAQVDEQIMVFFDKTLKR